VKGGTIKVNHRRSIASVLLALSWLWPALLAGSASATTPASVTIHTLRNDNGDSWSASGAVNDSGPFVDPVEFFAGKGSPLTTFHAVRTYEGRQGTFTVRAEVVITPSSDPHIAFFVSGGWAIIRGTGAYSDLRGQGTLHEQAVISPCCGLVGIWSGRVHYD
jgi:hypothetical protein